MIADSRVVRVRLSVVLALVVALVVTFMPLPQRYLAPVASSEAFAAPPPYLSWPDTSFVGKAKTSKIGYGLKAKPVKFSGYSQPGSSTNYIRFELKVTGKAKKQGIYKLAVYYRGAKVDVSTAEDAGGTTMSFGAVKGKVKSRVPAKAFVPSYYAIDRSQLKVKLVKFIPGYSLKVDTACAADKYNGMQVRIFDVAATKNTTKKVKMRQSLNGKGNIYIVKKNAKVRFYAFGIATGSDKVLQSGKMYIEVSVGSKVVAGSVTVAKGDEATGVIIPPISCPPPEWPSSVEPKNWRTALVKITENATAKIQSIWLTT
jgi:hypothetical protein